MKFQNCILINFERTHGRTEIWTHSHLALSNMPLQLFQSWGDKKWAICDGVPLAAVYFYVESFLVLNQGPFSRGSMKTKLENCMQLG